jgi:hypothetical protein
MKMIDPYYEWLGIPPKHHPPDHYRLLGLELFEDDRNVIATAADRQMTFIKNYQTGPPEAEELSQRILNELATARICLLTPEKKKAYDRSLQAELEKMRAEAMVSQTERLPGDDLSDQNRTSATTITTEPTFRLPTKSTVPVIPAPVVPIQSRQKQAPDPAAESLDTARASSAIAEPPLPRRPQIRRTSTEQSRIVPIAICMGIGCILLAGLLIAWVVRRSGRESPADVQSPILVESRVAIENDQTVEEPPAEPDPFELQPVEEPGGSAGSSTPPDDDARKHNQEPSDEPPDVGPVLALDSEPTSPPVEETLEQAEQRLIFASAGALSDSAREEFVREALAVTDRAIVDSQAELARRLAELALKVARASNSPELIQRVTLRLIEVRGPMTETLKNQARKRLDQP